MEQLRKQLTTLGQQHVLHYWDQLNSEEQNLLQSQLSGWNLTDACLTFAECMDELNHKQKSNAEQQQQLQQLPVDRYLSRSDISIQHLQRLQQVGLEAISAGKVGVVVLAGGQGTRLGYPHPKGLYNVGLPSGKSLFRLQVERLLRLQQLAAEHANAKSDKTANNQEQTVAGDMQNIIKPVHWFVMTSSATHQETVDFYEQQSYFGLQQEQVHFLQQKCAPCFTLEGQFMLSNRHRVAESPDGNGGIYSALYESGCLAKMDSLGITHVHVFCVDNILVRVADPAFIGFAIERSLAAVGKAVEKRSWNEPVGVFGLVQGRLRVLEYSEITEEQAKATDSDGKLSYRFGNICNHLFTVDFLKQVANTRLPQHVAKKKVPYLDILSGELVKPTAINGVKLEKFIFDVFELTSEFGIWIVPREEEFSPVKNSAEAKEDSEITARNDLYRLHTHYVQKANGKIIESSNKPIVCEISPLLSYDGENLETYVKNQQFISPLVLYAESEPFSSVINIQTN